MRINREERRQRIAQIAYEVIAREGLEAATFRRIATEAGMSTTFITKYFANKTELLLAAYRFSSANTLTRFEKRPINTPDDVIESLVTLTAADDLKGWRVHVVFWGNVAHDPILIARFRKEELAH
jgi:AcrR family transcriptional regulator